MATAVYFGIVFGGIFALHFHLDSLATGEIHNLFIYLSIFYGIVNSSRILGIVNDNSLREDLLNISIIHIHNWVVERIRLFEISLKMLSFYFSILIISFSLNIKNSYSILVVCFWVKGRMIIFNSNIVLVILVLFVLVSNWVHFDQTKILLHKSN